MEINKLLRQNRTLLVGIINTTPDSFSGDGIYHNIDQTVLQAKRMLEDGADILDIGGESSRPLAEQISNDEELNRVVPVIQAIKNKLGPDVLLSVDTYKSIVAKEAINAGASIINSLGGFTLDSDLTDIISKTDAYIMPYHMKGNFQTRHEKNIQNDIVQEIKEFFEEQIAIGIQYGIKRDRFLLDPGIGFSKTLEQTIILLQRLNELQTFHLPIVVGVSRKSHIGMLLQEELKLEEMPGTNERLEGALAETAIVVQKGAQIIRTHDVLATKRFLGVYERINR